jgi:hypothetical protein
VRRLIVLLLGVVVLMTPASPALARGDGWEFLPPVEAEDEFCGPGTDIAVQYDTSQEYGRVITRGGHQLLQINGALKATVTNMDSDVSIAINAPGPGLIYLDEPLVEGTGIWLFYLLPGQPGSTGVPNLFTTSGHFTFTIDQNGVFQSFSLNGEMTPLCPMIS